ncbi:MAG: hypothetical protein ACO3C1_07745 [Ilumatobacteraceae bacterium]
MTRGRALRIALILGLAVGAVSSTPAGATVSIKNSSVSCSLTAVLPTLSSTKQLSGSANVSCTASANTSVTVTVQVVELDGSTVNTMGNAFFISSTKSLVKSTKAVSWTVTTAAKACVNTDGAGKEDYATVALISAGGSTQTERIGKTDNWSC